METTIKKGGSPELTKEVEEVVSPIEQEEIKKNMWRDLGRIASAKPSHTNPPSPLTPPPKTFESEYAKFKISSSLIDWKEYTKGDISHWGDWTSQVVGFKSEKIEKKKVQCSNVEIQTEKILKKDTGVGNFGWTSAKTQTEIENSEKTQVEEITTENDPYPPSLYAFFSKVGDIMYRALSQNSKASDHLKSNREQNFYENPSASEDKEARFKLLQSKIPEMIHRLRTSTIPEGVEASYVSWSPSGTQVAVAHAAFQHHHFCRHHSVPLTIWSLASSLLKSGPLHEILFDGCITCIEFHPKHGNFLAFGFYSGEVGIINLNGAEQMSASVDFGFLQSPAAGDSKGESTSSNFEFKHNDAFVMMNGSCHAQSVTSIRWIHLSEKELKKLTLKKRNALPFMIVSTSLDGMIALWSVDKTTSRIVLERRYAIHTRVIPDSFKRKNRSDFMNVKQIGVRSWDSFRDDPTRFICSTYGSFLFQGNLMTHSKYSDDELNNARLSLSAVYDPQAIFIKQEVDYIQCVAANPFNPYLYIYATQNGHMYIRSVKFRDGEPILKTYLTNVGTYDVKWSIRPTVFGVINHKTMYVYDLLVNERLEVFSLQQNALCRCLAWSKAEINYVAVSDSDGFVNIWKLPEELTKNDHTEIEQLNTYAEFLEYTAPLENLNEDKKDLREEGDESLNTTMSNFQIMNEQIQILEKVSHN